MNTNYLQQRLDALGITAEDNYFQVKDDSPSGYHKHPFFTEDAEGNILIHYFTLSGQVSTYEAGRWRTEKPYRAKRLKEPKDDIKYITPSGTPTQIYHTPRIIEKYQAGQPIETLFIIEGQFKAFAGYLNGLDICGISGIWNFRKSKQPNLKEDLERLINDCKVKNIVLLFDADCFQIHYESEKDLAQRLHSFYGAVKAFREALKPYGVDTYFAHIHEQFLQKAKGLDDLYEAFPTHKAEITQDILCLSSSREYVTTYNISDLSLLKLKRHFYLSSVESFYQKFEGQIESREFIWNGGKYQYNEQKECVQLVRHPDATLYKRIGCEYYKLVQFVNSKGEINESLEPWQVSIIKEDYHNERGIKNFLSQIDKFDTFCNVPDHSESFKECIVTPRGTRNYNLYNPMKHQPQAGEWPITEAYLKHIFGTQTAPSGHPEYILGYDYLSILYRYPTEKLPILCLVSEERGTGKSSLLYWLLRVFGDNATICGNDDLQDNFNSGYLSKLLAMIDEGVIEKRVVLEKIKSLSVSPKSKLHGKGKNKVDIDIFLKFIFTSNDEDNFIFIHPKETRFWVRRVNPYRGIENPNLLKEMEEEIPAFLHFLKYRKIIHEKEGRMWFKPTHLITPALLRVMKASKGSLEKEIRIIIREKMLDYMTLKLCLPYTEVERLVNNGRRYQRYQITKVLREILKLEEKNSTYISYQIVGSGENKQIQQNRDKGRHYIFRAEDFLNPEEIGLINKNQ